MQTLTELRNINRSLANDLTNRLSNFFFANVKILHSGVKANF